jgi:ribosomal protein S18 acetylase RimI-like enzyme
MSQNIRAITRHDLEDLKAVIESSGLFPPELLEGMLSGFFADPENQEIWLTKIIDEKPVAIAYCAPERMTTGTSNLYLIAVHKTHQGKGIGSELMNYLETLLKSKGFRILLVETSGLPEFELTRQFYLNCKFTKEAIVRDFYNEGEDKVVFWKKLN